MTSAKDWLDDIRTAVAFLTRVKMPHPDGPAPSNFVRAHRVFPLVGAAIGAIVGIVHVALASIGLPVLAAAVLALGAGALLTGALHEDGLADVVDGFGGGRDRAAKLEIMRDSRLGTFGGLALLVGLVAKAAALAALPLAVAIPSLIACHALARGTIPTMAMVMPYARKEGLAATAGRPDTATAATAIILALAIAVTALSWTSAAVAFLLVAASTACVAALAQRQIGGQTGDVLGCAEQVGEMVVLLWLAARLG